MDPLLPYKLALRRTAREPWGGFFLVGCTLLAAALVTFAPHEVVGRGTDLDLVLGQSAAGVALAAAGAVLRSFDSGSIWWSRAGQMAHWRAHGLSALAVVATAMLTWILLAEGSKLLVGGPPLHWPWVELVVAGIGLGSLAALALRAPVLSRAPGLSLMLLAWTPEVLEIPVLSTYGPFSSLRSESSLGVCVGSLGWSLLLLGISLQFSNRPDVSPQPQSAS